LALAALAMPSGDVQALDVPSDWNVDAALLIFAKIRSTSVTATFIISPKLTVLVCSRLAGSQMIS
jgi:hypothetical protein